MAHSFQDHGGRHYGTGFAREHRNDKGGSGAHKIVKRFQVHDRTVRITRCGRICIGKHEINLSQIFAGRILRITEADDRIWLVSFLSCDPGLFAASEGRAEPTHNPFTPEHM